MNRNLLGMNKNLLGIKKNLLGMKKNLLGMKENLLGIPKYILGMNKYLLGIFIAIIIAIIVTVTVISVKESKKKKKVKFVVYQRYRVGCRMRVSGKQRLLHAPLKKLKRWARYKKWVKVTELNCDMSVNDGPGRPCDGKWGDPPLIYYFVDGDKKGKCYKGKRTFRKMRDFIRDKAKS